MRYLFLFSFVLLAGCGQPESVEQSGSPDEPIAADQSNSFEVADGVLRDEENAWEINAELQGGGNR